MRPMHGGSVSAGLEALCAAAVVFRDELAGSAGRLMDADLLAEAREFETLRRCLATVDHVLVGECERRGLGQSVGAQSTSGLLQGLSRISRFEAKRRVLAAGALGARSSLTGRGLAETSFGQLMTIEQALRLADEAALVGLVCAANGAVLKLGLSQRFANRPQTLALIASDKGCSFPGCDAPAEHCQRHHVIPWWLGGPTNIDTSPCCAVHLPRIRQTRLALRHDRRPALVGPPVMDRAHPHTPTKPPNTTGHLTQGSAARTVKQTAVPSDADSPVGLR